MTDPGIESPSGVGRSVDLSLFRPVGFDRGAGPIKEALWILFRTILFERWPFKAYWLKRFVLRLFGANVGRNPVIKPGVRITFPWKLELGDHVWLGEDCWLLNLETIRIGSHVCVSQRAVLCTASHDYKSPAFDLIVRPIVLLDGCWIAAGAWVGPGVTVGSHAVLTAGSVAAHDLDPYWIYRGNPAAGVRLRRVEAHMKVKLP